MILPFNSFFFSTILKETNNITPVIKTKIGLYFVIPAKRDTPIVPKPRNAKIKPPPQQRAAKAAGNIENILNNFSFMSAHPLIILTKLYQTPLQELGN